MRLRHLSLESSSVRRNLLRRYNTGAITLTRMNLRNPLCRNIYRRRLKKHVETRNFRPNDFINVYDENVSYLSGGLSKLASCQPNLATVINILQPRLWGDIVNGTLFHYHPSGFFSKPSIVQRRNQRIRYRTVGMSPDVSITRSWDSWMVPIY